ncbi:hypothetical protein [Clostridium folliculivorans]|uniref:DUF5808 domain-containing protein n=1 Tax=Clostridium folliculivorans TaxID=2886038 RepID=A0A9W5Y1C5_9CLOT|nr:hypothetical protein [Clostridium folliculivorans]GKU24939.1 hypothetical protein CFOLD11_17650 [Clostridium folliculivorans]GKU31037.1 hypothetical protein CFB3_31440 [Clostridium folliculivorans]
MNNDSNDKNRKFLFFYYNPEDPSSTVDRKNGKGVTINFASKEGRRLFLFLMIPAIMMMIIVVFIAILSNR